MVIVIIVIRAFMIIGCRVQIVIRWDILSQFSDDKESPAQVFEKAIVEGRADLVLFLAKIKKTSYRLSRSRKIIFFGTEEADCVL